VIEKILAIGVLIGLIIRDGFGFALVEQPIFLFASFLALLYLLGNWWTIKPNVVSARTITVSILYGFASSCLTFALIFKLFYYEGSDQMIILGWMLLILSLTVDLISSFRKKRVLNNWLIWRLTILLLLATSFFFTAEDMRVRVTYRNYPDFLQYYEVNKDSLSVYDIQQKYFRNDVR
jgi:hypothetical protein